MAGAVLTIIGPNLLSQITDLISNALGGEIDLAAISRIGVLLLVIYGFSAVFTYVEHYIMATVTLDLSRDLRQDLSRKINRVPMSYFNKVSYGDILSRVTNDVSTLQQALANSLPSMISAAAQFVGCLIMMFATEWRMALAAIGVTLLGFVIMAVVMLRSQRYFVARQENLSTLNGYIEEMYSGHDVVPHLPGQRQDQEDLWRHEHGALRRRVAQPVPVRHHAAPDDHCGQPGLCGGVRAGLRPGHERPDLLRRHRGLHPLCAAVHLSAEHPGPGHDPDADGRRRRRSHL